MSNVAPSCPITLPSKPPSAPGITMPSVPKAQDLPSVIAAVNALTQLMQTLAGINLPRNNLAPQALLGNLKLPQFNFGNQQSPFPFVGRFVELRRTTEIVRVTNPNDVTVYVDIARINTLTMIDILTAELWVWRR